MDGDYDPETGEVAAAIPRMPPVIAAAIIAVKKQVKQLGADDKNQHGGYAFVSVDKFYERIGPLMAAQGLALLIDEVSTDVREGKSGNPWLFVRYNLRFLHETGATSPPLGRSCALPISGPQAFGAAQSYIEKQFLRQIFKIPTGERDADGTASSEDAPAGTSGGRTAPQASAPARSYPARQQAAPAPSEKRAEADKRWREIRDEINASMTFADLDQIPSMLAWAACESAYIAAAIEEGADQSAALQRAAGPMDGLRSRIESRRMMLQDQAEGR
jgi:ERF superfamily protein